jgi:hypothetical protein
MHGLTKTGCLGVVAFALACGPGGEAPDAAAAALSSGAKGGGAREGGAFLKVDSMVGVPRPYTGAANAIRGVPGGGLPWVIAQGEAKLERDGTLKAEVEGLVFDPDDAVVIERGLAGRNTVAQFGATVSCQTVVDGAAVVVNVAAAPVPATQGLASEGGGNASFKERLALPSPCIAPIVFITSPAGAWFAASGF